MRVTDARCWICIVIAFYRVCLKGSNSLFFLTPTHCIRSRSQRPQRCSSCRLNEVCFYHEVKKNTKCWRRIDRSIRRKSLWSSIGLRWASSSVRSKKNHEELSSLGLTPFCSRKVTPIWIPLLNWIFGNHRFCCSFFSSREGHRDCSLFQWNELIDNLISWHAIIRPLFISWTTIIYVEWNWPNLGEWSSCLLFEVSQHHCLPSQSP